MDAARPDFQRNTNGREVEWNDGFVDELKLGLVACRVLFVSLMVMWHCSIREPY